MQWLITGCDRAIGRTIAREASLSGHQVRALVADPEQPSSRALVEHAPDVKLVKHSWSDPEEALIELMEGCSIVAHTDVGNPWSLSRKECETDVLVHTEVVLACAKKAGVKRVLFRSSDRVTSDGDERRNVSETIAHSTKWLSPWDEMMSVAEGLALTSSIEGVALRTSYVWGDDDDESLPRLKFLSEKGALNLPGGGDVSFCTTHIENLALAFVAAAKTDKIAGNVYWIIDEDLITARKFLTRLLVANGLKGPRSGMLPYRAAAVLRALHQSTNELSRTELAMFGVATSLDPRCARHDLDYAPRVHIDEGLQRMVLKKST